jgi:hypothetical protein
MTMKRTFTAAELARLFKSQANEANDFRFDLGGGLIAVQMAEHSGLVFQIERGGQAHALDKADAAELEEISAALWDRYAPFLGTLEDDIQDLLIPDELREPVDPLAGTVGGLIPAELREAPDPLDGTVEGLLTPLELREQRT